MKCTQSILEESAGYRIFFNLSSITKLLKEEESNVFVCYDFQEVSNPFQWECDTSAPSWGSRGDVPPIYISNIMCIKVSHIPLSLYGDDH